MIGFLIGLPIGLLIGLVGAPVLKWAYAKFLK